MWLLFFSSRRRHTRCALVTGVQTCALPILQTEIEHGVHFDGYNLAGARVDCEVEAVHHVVSMFSRPVLGICGREVTIALRSDERRVGKECVSTCRSRWSPYH